MTTFEGDLNISGTADGTVVTVTTDASFSATSTFSLDSSAGSVEFIVQTESIDVPITVSGPDNTLTSTVSDLELTELTVNENSSLVMDSSLNAIIVSILTGSGDVTATGDLTFANASEFTGSFNTTENSSLSVGDAPQADISLAPASTLEPIPSNQARSLKNNKVIYTSNTYNSLNVTYGDLIDLSSTSITISNDFTVDGSATILYPNFDATILEVSGNLIINNGSVLTIKINSANLTAGIFDIITFSDLSGGVSSSFVIDLIGTSSQYMVAGELGDTSYTVTVTSIAPCFLAGTPIVTNQGIIDIDKIDPSRHTIRNKKIVAITKTIIPHKYLVQFEKNALGKNMPSERTIISQNHIIFYKGKQVKAKDFVNDFAGVKKIPYKGEVLYNVLLEQHDKMMVNNLICETMHPDNMVARLFKQLPNLTAEQVGEILLKLNNQFLKNKKGDTKVVLHL